MMLVSRIKHDSLVILRLLNLMHGFTCWGFKKLELDMLSQGQSH